MPSRARSPVGNLACLLPARPRGTGTAALLVQAAGVVPCVCVWVLNRWFESKQGSGINHACLRKLVGDSFP